MLSRRARTALYAASLILVVPVGLPRYAVAQVVYDSTLNVYWLANANLAGDAKVRAEMRVAGVTANGMMSYETALNWVKALNGYHGTGWLGHHDWQLPDSPMLDPSCGSKGPGGASFGGLCRSNALGHLYYSTLHLTIPKNVSADTGASVGPLRHVMESYYWTSSDGGIGGKKVFSLAAGDGTATTTYDNFYYVLPMVKGEIGTHAPCSRGAIVAYTAGLPANRAVYDCDAKITWPVDANLAATLSNGITANVSWVEKRPYPDKGGHPVTVTSAPIVGGAMLFSTAQQWVAALDTLSNGRDQPKGYLGSATWQLPEALAGSDLNLLSQHLNLSDADVGKLQATGATGSFQNIQPFFYWEHCVVQPIDYQVDQAGAKACAKGNAPSGRSGGQMEYDFTFGYGIQSTDADWLKYFVTVYYPGPTTQRPPTPLPPRPLSPELRCAASGGTWRNGRCQ